MSSGAHQFIEARQRIAAIGLLAAEALRVDHQNVLIADPLSAKFAQAILDLLVQ